MTKPTRIEIDCTTGIETIIELTDEEMAEMEAAAKQYEKNQKAKESQAKADAIAKIAVLEKLGITAEEAALLLK
jgi:hypothetical protein